MPTERKQLCCKMQQQKRLSNIANWEILVLEPQVLIVVMAERKDLLADDNVWNDVAATRLLL